MSISFHALIWPFKLAARADVLGDNLPARPASRDRILSAAWAGKGGRALHIADSLLAGTALELFFCHVPLDLGVVYKGCAIITGGG